MTYNDSRPEIKGLKALAITAIQPSKAGSVRGGILIYVTIYTAFERFYSDRQRPQNLSAADHNILRFFSEKSRNGAECVIAPLDM